MDRKYLSQSQVSSWKVAIVPAGIAVSVWLVLHFAYELLGFFENVSIYRTLASVNWILLVISVGFSSLVVYPSVYFKGASTRVCIFTAYILPFAWCIKEFIRVSASVTTAEALFYVLFTPVQLLILIGQVGLIGIGELLCRYQAKKRGQAQRVFSPVPFLAICFSAITLYTILIRGGGYDFHLMVKLVYRSLFM